MTAGKRETRHMTRMQMGLHRREVAEGAEILMTAADVRFFVPVLTATTDPMSEMTRKSSNSHLITCTDTTHSLSRGTGH